jgi:hypothetical protein
MVSPLVVFAQAPATSLAVISLAGEALDDRVPDGRVRAASTQHDLVQRRRFPDIAECYEPRLIRVVALASVIGRFSPFQLSTISTAFRCRRSNTLRCDAATALTIIKNEEHQCEHEQRDHRRAGALRKQRPATKGAPRALQRRVHAFVFSRVETHEPS